MHQPTELFSNKALLAAIVAWAIAQFIKTVTDVIEQKKFNLEIIFSSGGMPSSHSSFVMSMATYMGLSEGFDSPFFSIAAMVAIVVMYDAAGVRRAAGKQAALLNKMIDTFDLKVDEKFKELLGHTPVQVIAGALLGIIVGSLFFWANM